MRTTNYQQGDELAILNLFKTAFDKDLSIEYWNWRYLQNPFDKIPKIKLLWDEDKLIGHYAISPTMLMINNKPELCALSMTTMTHPEYAGRGIFKELASKLYHEISEQYNFKLVWGFPNRNSHYGFIKNLNWKDINTIPMLRIDDNTVTKYNNKFPYNLITEFNDIHSSILINQLKDKVGVYKSLDYLNWRYLNNPSNKYICLSPSDSTNNFVIFKFFRIENSIEVDILEMGYEIKNIDTIISLINCIYSYSSNLSLNIKSINLWKSIYSSDYYLFEKAGFIADLPLTYLSYRAFDNLTTKIAPISWDYSLGDSDVF